MTTEGERKGMNESASLEEAVALPFVVIDGDAGVSFAEWYGAHREEMEQRLLRHGAILFRGFGIRTQEGFEQAVRGLGEPTLDYVDGNSPRQKLAAGVYTSTEYPPELFISLRPFSLRRKVSPGW